VVAKQWRQTVLALFGLAAVGAMILGFMRPAPGATAPRVLPPAVGGPHASGQTVASAASPTGEQATSPEARIAALREELKGSPADAERWAQLGALYAQLRRWPGAADAYSAALDLQPTNSSYRSNLAYALFFAGMTGMALKQYQQVVIQEPESSEAHMNLGVALSHSSPPDIEAATREWMEVVRLAPGEPVAAKAEEYLAAYRKP